NARDTLFPRMAEERIRDEGLVSRDFLPTKKTADASLGLRKADRIPIVGVVLICPIQGQSLKFGMPPIIAVNHQQFPGMVVGSIELIGIERWPVAATCPNKHIELP